MPNPLTGDFEAVLQVSGATINRLLASMHQNASAKPNLPSFPHSVRMRVGDNRAIDGVRGSADVQVSVPHVELIHGVTDRFILEVGIRAWYRPDPGTSPLPTFIHGTVRAEYRIRDIDPACRGWAKRAADYLWIRVVRDSVRFEGTAQEDESVLGGGISILPVDTAVVDAANMAKITKQIAGLLATRFEATPHPVSNRFRRGLLRSLNAPIGGSAVVTPIGLSGEPAGNIASVNNLLLEGADLAVAIDVGYIMSIVNPALDAIKTFSKTVKVHVSTPWPAPDIDTVYHAGLHPPKVAWQAHGSYAVFNIKVSGWATTRSILANATFDVEENIFLYFDSGAGRLWLSPGSPGVKVHSSGLGSGEVASAVRDAVVKAVGPIVTAACAQAQPTLDGMTTRTQELSEQLQTLDDQATLGLDQAQFVKDGIVLRGWIGLESRHGLMVKFKKTVQQDGHSALESWIPGGRIDKFEWSWTWTGSGKPGKATYDDRFLLRRPGGRVGRWGMALDLQMPLPGLDGWGTVCLKIKGVRVDSVTGQLVAVESTKRCTRFGLNISDALDQGGRLFLRDMPELSKRVPFPELSLVRAGVASDATRMANTLLLYVEEAWDEETASALKGGLEACGRYDAGLALLVLFREGLLAAAGPRLMAMVEEFARELGIAALVNEDVRGGWSRSLSLRSGTAGPAWGLISPEGTVTWTHQGHISPEHLTEALDSHLRRSPDVSPVEFRQSPEIGRQISSTALHPGFFELVESPCPPPPFGRLGGSESIVAFVQKDSASSHAQLRALTSKYEQREGEPGPVVVVVVDGADEREAEALKNQLGFDFVTLPDPVGTITDRFGIGIWPTTITLDRVGTISGLETGVMAAELDDGVGQTEAAE
ncbi:MAG: hypothetical protein H0U18_11970 [Pyrinomonadaceae bacterium]|nr:hypothetical protein [Pyrinomonadaceae bacterium]